MSRPRLLDLFCGAGGAAMGYHRAGFDVVGVDNRPQPHYPFAFIQADALGILDQLQIGWPIGHIDAIHASPPCQKFTQMSARWRGAGFDDKPDFLTPTLAILRTLGLPYVVENVPGAKHHMRATLVLHGGMFGLGVHRPRLFECSHLVLAPKTPLTFEPVGVYGTKPDGRRLWTRQNGNTTGKRSIMRAAKSLEEAQQVMGMDWGDWHGVKEAIPPAYTEYIGRQLLGHLAAEVAS